MQNNIKRVESILCAECINTCGHRILHIIKQTSEVIEIKDNFKTLLSMTKT